MKHTLLANLKTLTNAAMRVFFTVWTTILYVLLRLLPGLFRTSKNTTTLRIPLPATENQTDGLTLGAVFPRGTAALGVYAKDVRLGREMRLVSADVTVSYRRAPFGLLHRFQERRIQSLTRRAANRAWLVSAASHSKRPVPVTGTEHALRPPRREFRINGSLRLHEAAVRTHEFSRTERRVLITSLHTEHASQLIAPPLRPLIGTDGTTELACVVSLASSLSVRPKSQGFADGMRARFWPGQFNSRVDQEPTALLSLYMSVESQTTHGALRSFVLLFAAAVPMVRPGLPTDHYTGSYRLRTEGLRFCLGDRNRRLLFHGIYRLVRPFTHGDMLPDVLRPDRILTDFSDELDMLFVREEVESAVNRMYVVETAPFPEQLPGPADFFEDFFGVPFREGRTCFAPELTIRTREPLCLPLSSFEFRIPTAVTESSGPPIFEEPSWPDPRSFSFVTDTGR
ncbi:MAG: hypothetical protein HY042_01055 [Spirochaetia bacterium]|nr:hypothetical protein [Spirochaetia bacterium]